MHLQQTKTKGVMQVCSSVKYSTNKKFRYMLKIYIGPGTLNLMCAVSSGWESTARAVFVCGSCVW